MSDAPSAENPLAELKARMEHLAKEAGALAQLELDAIRALLEEADRRLDALRAAGVEVTVHAAMARAPLAATRFGVDFRVQLRRPA